MRLIRREKDCKSPPRWIRWNISNAADESLGAVAALGGMLSIKPMIELKDGEVKPIGAVRTTKQADERMLKFLLELGDMERLAVLHTNAEPRAKNFVG
jgi:fatty acid-binding protein DegV